MKVVFLDFDGVVNRKMWVNEDGKWVCRYGYPEDGAVNDVQSVQWVSEFCEKYGYDIVVTSSWRKYGYEKYLRAAGLRDGVRVVGATAISDGDRSQEISDYLSSHPEVESYLVFDDDESLMRKTYYFDEDTEYVFPTAGEHYKHLVLCDSRIGFGENEYNKAVATHISLKYRRVDEAPSMHVRKNDEEQMNRAIIELLYTLGHITTAVLQRKLSLGYGRAAQTIDGLVSRGVIIRTEYDGRFVYRPLVEREEAERILGISQ